MNGKKFLGLAAAVFSLAVTPALAEDTTYTKEECLQEVCPGDPAKADKSAQKQTKSKSQKSAQKATDATEVGKTDATGINVTVEGADNDREDYARADERLRAEENLRAIEAARAEERARAAEMARAEESRLSERHALEIEAARAQERDRVRAEMQREIDMAVERSRAAEVTDSEGAIADALITPFGMQVTVGGGVTNFTESRMESATIVGGMWDARLGLGTRSYLGAEIAYVGSAQDIDGLGLNQGAFLMSNGVEGVARLNAPIAQGGEVPLLLEPYAFGGVGYSHYFLANEGESTSDVLSNDDIMTIPVGLGVAFGVSGVTLDARATYRHALFSDLVGSSRDSFGSTSLNNWSLGAGLGFEF